MKRSALHSASKFFVATLASTTLALAITSCGKGGTTNSATTADSGPSPAHADAPAPNASPSPAASDGPQAIEAATGWLSFQLQHTNRTDTTIDSLGHFSSQWNPCTYNDQDGVFTDLTVWNALVKALNDGLKLAPLTKDNMICIKPPALQHGRDFDVGMDGDMVVTIDNAAREKRLVFESRNTEETCTTIPDKKIAEELLAKVNAAAAQTANAVCPIPPAAPATPAL